MGCSGRKLCSPTDCGAEEDSGYREEGEYLELNYLKVQL